MVVMSQLLTQWVQRQGQRSTWASFGLKDTPFAIGLLLKDRAQGGVCLILDLYGGLLGLWFGYCQLGFQVINPILAQ